MHYHFTENRQRAVCPLVYAGAFGHFLQTAAAFPRRKAGQSQQGREEEESEEKKPRQAQRGV